MTDKQATILVCACIAAISVCVVAITWVVVKVFFW